MSFTLYNTLCGPCSKSVPSSAHILRCDRKSGSYDPKRELTHHRSFRTNFCAGTLFARSTEHKLFNTILHATKEPDFRHFPQSLRHGSRSDSQAHNPPQVAVESRTCCDRVLVGAILLSRLLALLTAHATIIRCAGPRQTPCMSILQPRRQQPLTYSNAEIRGRRSLHVFHCVLTNAYHMYVSMLQMLRF